MFMKPNYFLVLLCLAGASSGARPAFAQTTEERAGARSAADRGYDAFKAGDWAEALDLFGRAESVVHSPVHSLYIARSHARLGQLIEAQEAYLRIVREGMSPGASAAMRAARKEAEAELIPLEPQIPVVTLIVEGQTGGETLQVQQDGRSLPPALLGVARPLNPGEYTWQARSASQQSAAETRTVTAGTQTTVTLRLEAAPESAAGMSSGEPGSPVHDGTPRPHVVRGPSGWVYAGFGVAVTGLALGTGFLLYQGRLEDRIRCDATGCPENPENLELKADADRAGLFAAIGFATGGVGLVSALAFWAFAPNDPGPESASTKLKLQPWVGWNSAGVSGSF
jgi:hypothetical protein